MILNCAVLSVSVKTYHKMTNKFAHTFPHRQYYDLLAFVAHHRQNQTATFQNQHWFALFCLAQLRQSKLVFLLFPWLGIRKQ